MIIAGTHDGVYRISGVAEPDKFEYTNVLNTETAMRVRDLDVLDGVFAATKSGLYHSLDGNEWANLGVPRKEVYSVVANPMGDRLYAGTHPAHLYVCTAFSQGVPLSAAECEWHELNGFQNLPSRKEWHTPRHRNKAQIRSLGTHPDAPDRVIAGVEAGGVHISNDKGETWEERTEGVPDDIHHLLIRSADEYIASTGVGLYRTEDAGASWVRLDRDVGYRYFRETTHHQSALYAAAATGPSPNWDDGVDAAVFMSEDGHSLEAIEFSHLNEIVLAWTVVNGSLIAGTNGGTLLRRRENEWNIAGELPVGGQGIRSLCPDPERKQ